MELHDPDLYAAGEQRVLLLGARCTSCQRASFPRTAYGCPHCSAEAEKLVDVELSSFGELKTAVTIYQAIAPGMKVPCVVGRVALDDGIVEDAYIVAAEEFALKPGVRVRGVLLPEERGGATKLGFRFEPVES